MKRTNLKKYGLICILGLLITSLQIHAVGPNELVIESPKFNTITTTSSELPQEGLGFIKAVFGIEVSLEETISIDDSNGGGGGGGVINPSTPAQVTTRPLFFPNPFRLNEGSKLGFRLSAPLDIELRIYNRLGYEVFRNTYTQDNFVTGYNKIDINRSVIGAGHMPAGIYYFIIMNNGQIVGKGKFGLIP